MDLSEFMCYYGAIYDPLLFIPSTIVIAQIGNDYDEKKRIVVLTLLLVLAVHIIKHFVDSDRPCQIEILPCCPDNNDIPSAHAALGIYHGLLFYNHGYKLLSLLFFFMPISRYIGKQHSITAIVIGCIMGYICYIIMGKLS